AGNFHGIEAVAVFSRWGKVAAAATVTQLVATFPVSRLVLSGVAGGMQPGLVIGDVVVGAGLLQHDLDASPIFPRYEVPLLGKSVLEPDAGLRDRLVHAAEGFLRDDLGTQVAPDALAAFAIRSPRVVSGIIASGDKFFASAAEADELRGRLPGVACVEMEGGAVAQVCEEYGIPFGVVRTVSDAANERSGHDFPRFIRDIARHYSAGILARFARGL
ncbi:MAG: 5'-methylthioadenosine/adenosylhomocysteine nucleosidase, partial [Steroidobacteraceae bacterium]